jgi:hypothetical protein
MKRWMLRYENGSKPPDENDSPKPAYETGILPIKLRWHKKEP